MLTRNENPPSGLDRSDLAFGLLHNEAYYDSATLVGALICGGLLLSIFIWVS